MHAPHHHTALRLAFRYGFAVAIATGAVLLTSVAADAATTGGGITGIMSGDPAVALYGKAATLKTSFRMFAYIIAGIAIAVFAIMAIAGKFNPRMAYMICAGLGALVIGDAFINFAGGAEAMGAELTPELRELLQQSITAPGQTPAADSAAITSTK